MRTERRFERAMTCADERPSRRVASVAPVFVGCLLAVHCGGDDTNANAGPGGPGGDDAAVGADGTGGPGGDRGGGDVEGGVPSSCEPFGRYGVPTKTFTLPAGTPTISYPDIQAKFPEVDWANLESKLSAWGATATLAPGAPPIQYAVGDLVMHDAELYRAKTANTNAVPTQHPEAWEKLPRPADDVRVAPGTPYDAMGVR